MVEKEIWPCRSKFEETSEQHRKKPFHSTKTIEFIKFRIFRNFSRKFERAKFLSLKILKDDLMRNRRWVSELTKINWGNGGKSVNVRLQNIYVQEGRGKFIWRKIQRRSWKIHRESGKFYCDEKSGYLEEEEYDFKFVSLNINFLVSPQT